MSSLRYALNAHGLIRPDPKGEFVPFTEWEKMQSVNHEIRAKNFQLMLQIDRLKIELAVAIAERTS